MSRSARYRWELCCHWPASRHVWIAGLVLVTLLPSGCVRRRLMVRSNPPGALVYVDNQQIGTTPCSVDFTYYGTREIRLVKAGYETLTVNQPIPTPWYEVPPLDFVSENLSPTEIRDNRTVTYNLAPQVIVPTQQLLDRADRLRQETLQAPVVPAGVEVPLGAMGPGTWGPPSTYPSAPAPFSPTPAPTYWPPAVPPATTAPPPTTTPLMPSPLPTSPPAAPPSSQQGRPLVSPPLR